MTVVAWTRKCTSPEEKEKRLQSLKRVNWVFDDLKEIINDCISSVESAEISPKSYDSANWAYRQAHANGYKQAMRDFNKLITLDLKEENGRQPIDNG